MSRKFFRPVVVASVAMMTIGATSAVTAGASTASTVTICVNKSNGVVHFAPSGQCGRTQTRVIVGKGAVGARGLVGVVGPAGGTGAPGPAGGPQGLQGIQGIRGPQGLKGVDGAQGVDGPQGLAGPQGVIGPIGGTGPAGVAGPAGGVGAAGPAGPAGVNAFHIVTNTSILSGTTMVATCAAGEKVTGGGFTGPLGLLVTTSQAHAGGVSWDLTYTGNTGGATVTVQGICVAGTESP